MGRFLNPDNSAFQVALNSQIYVDKTGLIEYTNSVLDTNQAMVCNSRPHDMVSFADKDDVITLLIHLGYLAYDSVKKAAFIPNEEIRQEFMTATKKKKWNELPAGTFRKTEESVQ